MAELTDEEKVKNAFPGVDEAKASDETKGEPSNQTEEEKTPPEAKATDETTKVDPEADDSKSTLTNETDDKKVSKPYEWLKGENPEDWVKELQTAYDNSTSGALALKKRAEDAEAIVEEAKRVIATGGKTETGAQPSALDLSNVPEIQIVRAQQQKLMEDAYNDFAKDFTQARQPDEVDKLVKVLPGVGSALEASLGRIPTYPELYDKAAAILGWQPDKSAEQAKKDAAIKEASASQDTSSSRKSTVTSKVTEEQLKVARRLFPNQTDEEIVKDLSQYVS